MTKVPAEHIKAMTDSLTYKFHWVPGSTVTACWAFLPNGFQVGYGESACVDPSEFQKTTGEYYARQECEKDAANKLWELEGYLLKVTGCLSDEF